MSHLTGQPILHLCLLNQVASWPEKSRDSCVWINYYILVNFGWLLSVCTVGRVRRVIRSGSLVGSSTRTSRTSLPNSLAATHATWQDQSIKAIACSPSNIHLDLFHLSVSKGSPQASCTNGCHASISWDMPYPKVKTQYLGHKSPITPLIVILAAIKAIDTPSTRHSSPSFSARSPLAVFSSWT
jgi:hypothetical protein